MKTALIIIFPLIAVLGPAAELAGQSAFGAPVVVESEWWYNTTPVFIQNSGDIISPSAPSNSVTIQGNSQVVFTSATEIVLNPGFEVSALSGEGYFHAFIDQEMNDFEVVAINAHPPNFEVGEYEKLELGIKLPEEINILIASFFQTCDIEDPNDSYDESIGLNPYNFDDINLQAEFTSPSGKVKVIDGFFFRDAEYGLNPYWPFWTIKHTDYPFRVRFSPEEQGSWKCKLKVFINNQEVPDYEAGPFLFNCVPSYNPGFVEVGHHNNALRFSKTKQTYFPIGLNTPSPGISGTFDRYLTQRALWGSIAFHGGNMVSLPLIFDEYALEWEYQGVYDKYKVVDPAWTGYGNRQFQARDADELFDLAHELGLYVKVWVTPHQHWSIDSNCHFDTGPYNVFNIPRDQMTMDDICYFFNSSSLQDKYLNYCRYLIARWGYSSNILWWETFTEIDNCGCFDNRTGHETAPINMLASNFNTKLYNFFKTKDPNHLASGSYANDLVTLYDDLTNVKKYGKSEDLNKIRYENVQNRPWLTVYGADPPVRPLIYSETATTSIDADFCNITSVELGGAIEACNPVSFRTMLWSTSLSGCAGAGQNWMWKALYENAYLDQLQPVSSFMSGADFENNLYIPSKWLGKKYFESYQLRNFDRTRGMGWIHNRSYFWYSFSLNISKCKWLGPFGSCDIEPDNDNIPHESDYWTFHPLSGEVVQISNLKSSIWPSNQHKYQVDWYRTSGQPPYYFSPFSGIQQTNLFGNIRMVMPPTNEDHTDWAYKLEYVGTAKSSITLSQETSGYTDNGENVAGKVPDKDPVHIIPNPNNGIFRITGISGLHGYQIQNMSGSIEVTNTGVSEAIVDCRVDVDLPAGFYIIIIQDHDQIYRKKVCIVK